MTVPRARAASFSTPARSAGAMSRRMARLPGERLRSGTRSSSAVRGGGRVGVLDDRADAGHLLSQLGLLRRRDGGVEDRCCPRTASAASSWRRSVRVSLMKLMSRGARMVRMAISPSSMPRPEELRGIRAMNTASAKPPMQARKVRGRRANSMRSGINHTRGGETPPPGPSPFTERGSLGGPLGLVRPIELSS